VLHIPRENGSEQRSQADNGQCSCDCHSIAASGRKAVVAKLLEGVDFSSLFQPDLFETTDLDAEQERLLASFKCRLLCAPSPVVSE
jgi:hypothetical protein